MQCCAKRHSTTMLPKIPRPRHANACHIQVPHPRACSQLYIPSILEPSVSRVKNYHPVRHRMHEPAVTEWHCLTRPVTGMLQAVCTDQPKSSHAGAPALPWRQARAHLEGDDDAQAAPRGLVQHPVQRREHLLVVRACIQGGRVIKSSPSAAACLATAMLPGEMHRVCSSHRVPGRR